jgi:uncharacterized protein
VYAGVMSVDLLLESRSLKQKRSVVRPLISRLRREFAVAAAESGHLDLLGRTEIAVAVVAADMGHCWLTSPRYGSCRPAAVMSAMRRPNE